MKKVSSKPTQNFVTRMFRIHGDTITTKNYTVSRKKTSRHTFLPAVPAKTVLRLNRRDVKTNGRSFSVQIFR